MSFDKIFDLTAGVYFNFYTIAAAETTALSLLTQDALLPSFPLVGLKRGQIGFNEEVRKESEEVLEAERIAKEADKKPLWEQLAGKRDEKQAKFDAVRASMFGAFLMGMRGSELRHRAQKRKNMNPVRDG